MGDAAVQALSTYPASAGGQNTGRADCIWAPQKKESLPRAALWAVQKSEQKYFFPLLLLCRKSRRLRPRRRDGEVRSSNTGLELTLIL